MSEEIKEGFNNAMMKVQHLRRQENPSDEPQHKNTAPDWPCADEKITRALIETFGVPAVVDQPQSAVFPRRKEFHFQYAVAENQAEKGVGGFVNDGSGGGKKNPAFFTENIIPFAAETQRYQLKQQRQKQKTAK